MPLDKLFTLADSLAHSVMTALGVAPTAIAETRPSWQLVTTNSQEAYLAYVEGREALWKYRFREAQAPLRRAVEIDSSFAMAHFFLAGALWYSGDRIGFRKPAEQAWELREKVTERERLRIEAWYAGFIEKDSGQGMKINEQWREKYPNDPDPYFPLAAHYADLNQYEKSEKAHLQMLKLDPFAKLG